MQCNVSHSKPTDPCCPRPALFTPSPLQSPPFCQAGSPPQGGGGENSHEVMVPRGGGGGCTTNLYYSFTMQISLGPSAPCKIFLWWYFLCNLGQVTVPPSKGGGGMSNGCGAHTCPCDTGIWS